MICTSCGGTFAEDATKCPYCGIMHLAGATDAYNQKFEDMTDDLADLGDTHASEYKETIRKQTKRTFVFFCIAALLVLALAGFVGGVWYLSNNTNNTDELITRLAWQTENYPKLDALYEAGDFDAILAFELALFTDDDTTNDYTLYDWSHYDFLLVYDDYTDFCGTIQRYNQGDAPDTTDSARSLYFYFMYYEAPRYLDLSETDLVYIEDYIAQVAAFLETAFGLTEDDLANLQSTLADEDDWVSYRSCLDYIETYL